MFNRLMSDIRFEISEEILSLAMKGSHDLNTTELLRRNVFNKFVLDVNSYSANVIRLPVESLIVLANYSDPDAVRYKVPDSILQGRELVDVLYSAAGYSGSGTTPSGEAPNIDRSLSQLASSTIGTIAGYHSHELEIVSGNEFIVYGMPGNTVELIVSYSSTLRELGQGTTRELGEGFTMLVKAWLKAKLQVKLNQGSVYYGHELSSVRDAISEYSDAMNSYKEFRSTIMGKMLYMDNAKGMSNYMRTLVGNF